MAQTRPGDVIYALIGGHMAKVGSPQLPEHRNFVIVCDHGDWSGFRTLAECEVQFPTLESAGKHDGYYEVVER